MYSLTSMAECMLLSTPVHSRASVSGKPADSLIFSATCFGLQLRSINKPFTSGTSVFAKSRRFWNKSVMTIGSAPAARADRRDTRPMGPAPLDKHLISEYHNVSKNRWPTKSQLSHPGEVLPFLCQLKPLIEVHRESPPRS